MVLGGLMDGWMDGWMDEWVDGWMGGAGLKIFDFKRHLLKDTPI